MCLEPKDEESSFFEYWDSPSLPWTLVTLNSSSLRKWKFRKDSLEWIIFVYAECQVKRLVLEKVLEELSFRREASDAVSLLKLGRCLSQLTVRNTLWVTRQSFSKLLTLLYRSTPLLDDEASWDILVDAELKPSRFSDLGRFSSNLVVEVGAWGLLSIFKANHKRHFQHSLENTVKKLLRLLFDARSARSAVVRQWSQDYIFTLFRLCKTLFATHLFQVHWCWVNQCNTTVESVQAFNNISFLTTSIAFSTTFKSIEPKLAAESTNFGMEIFHSCSFRFWNFYMNWFVPKNVRWTSIHNTSFCCVRRINKHVRMCFLFAG